MQPAARANTNPLPNMFGERLKPIKRRGSSDWRVVVGAQRPQYCVQQSTGPASVAQLKGRFAETTDGNRCMPAFRAKSTQALHAEIRPSNDK
jgi:hypothetical protein